MRKLNSIRVLLTAGVVLGIMAVNTLADSLTVPIRIATSSATDGPTLGIPRWKAYMSPTDPNKMWIGYANNGSRSNNLIYTQDAGTTWSTNTTTINGYLDMHLSLSGSGDDLYFTFPSTSAIAFRHFNAPAESISDAGALVNLSGTTANHRSSIMVQNTGRIWVFTRLGGSATENVRYQYSDNGGSTWTRGVAVATGALNVRIGSMPYVNGNPVLVVLYLNDPRGYEYYLWNGFSFQAMSDHSIYPINPVNDRSFSHNQINDTIMHLVFGQGTNLRHVWKNYANGTGAWHTTIIATDASNSSIAWYPITTVRGNDMYVFYCRKTSADDASSRIYYKRWSQVTLTWSAEYQVSTQAYARDPNTAFHVPANSPYIPVTWRSGTGPFDVYFAKVVVPVDSIVPTLVYDMTIGSSPTTGGTTSPLAGTIHYLVGSSVSVAASAAIGYTFASWTGDVENPASPITAVVMNSNKTVTANFTGAASTIGSIHGLIKAGAIGLNGVYVDLYSTTGVPFARAISDQYGYYALINLPVDNYRMVVQSPIGFSVIGGVEQTVAVARSEVVRNLDLTLAVSPGVIDYWSWKREIVAISTGAAGAYGMTRAQIDGYLQTIFNAYYLRNDGHQTRMLYVTYTGYPARAMTLDDIIYQWNVLADNSSASIARKYLLADLLNIVSARISQLAIVTADGATASKALRYLSERFIAGPIDAALVDNISMIHQNQIIAAGVVDPATPNIMYGGFGELTRSPVIDCPTGPIVVQVCSPAHVCVPLVIEDYGQVIVTPAPATWLDGQLCFDLTDAKTYAFHIKVRPTEVGLDSAECDVNVSLIPLDLYVADADLSLAPAGPQVGQTVTVSAVVHNAVGSVTASNVVVRFFDGALPGGVQIGTDQIIPSLAAGSAATVQVNYVVGPLPRDIYAVVDPAGVLAECSEDNNTAKMTIQSGLATASIRGTVQTDIAGLYGVQVTLLNGASAVVKQAITAEDGQYLITGVLPGSYTVRVELPIGFAAVSAELVPITVAGTDLVVDFVLSLTNMSGIIDFWTWKREIVAISTGAASDYHMTRAQIDGYLQAIFDAYYNRNDGLQIRILNITYTGSPARAMTLNDVLYQWNVLVDNSTLHLGRKYLLADLLNVGATRLSQLAIVSTDGATATQALRYFADRFQAVTVDAALVTNIGRIHQRIMIPAGVIPLSTPNVVYKPDETSNDATLPTEFVLGQNYPNPFNPTTTIDYSVPAQSRVEIQIFNVLGQTVRTLVDEDQTAGSYKVTWNCTDDGGRQVSSGIYFYRITAGSFTQSKKMVLLK